MDDLRDIWQSQEVEEMKMSFEELRAKASKFQKRIRWRNLREQVACGVVIISFAAMGLKVPATVPRVSFGLIIAGAIYVAWHIQVWGMALALPADLGRASCLEFHRRELERQRDLLRNVWKWYLGPLVPGLALFVIWGIVVAPPERRWFPVAFAIFSAASFGLIGWLNRHAARRLDRQIEELDSYGAS
jgi:hypothetical protein